MTATVTACASITEVRADHVWTDNAGVTHGSLALGLPWIAFDDPEQVRDIARKLLGLACAMEAQATAYAIALHPETPDPSPNRRTE
jgi:hypothetical protein